MKNLFGIVLIFMAVSAYGQNTQSVSQDAEKHLKYLEFFDNQHAVVNNLTMSYLQYSVHSDDLDLIEQKRKALINQLDTSISQIKATTPVGEDNQLKVEAVSVYQLMKSSLKDDFAELLFLKANSQKSYDAMQSYFDARQAAENKINEASERFLKAQQDYALRHQIRLMEAPDNDNVKTLNELNTYHQTIMMKYFGVVLRNNDFFDAINSNAGDAAEQKRLALEKESEKALQELQQIPDYKGDSFYRDQAINLVKAFKELSSDGYQQIIKVMQLSPTERTQEDVDQYNQLLQKVNQEIPTLNQNVVQAGNELLKKHIPKPRVTRSL